MTQKPAPDVGRPRSDFDRGIANALMGAALELLQDRPRGEIAVREIAEAAGVSKAMVRYYFTNKEQLFEAILDNFMRDLISAYKKIEEAVIYRQSGETNSTRLIVQMISEIYATHHTSLRFLIVEISCNSELKRHYLDRLALRPTFILERVVSHLIEIGTYRSDLDPIYAALTLEWMLSQDVLTGCITSPIYKLAAVPGRRGDWIEHICQILDRGFQAAQVTTPLRIPIEAIRSDN